MHEVKQLKVIWVSISDVDDTEDNNQQELQKLYQSTTDDEKTELNNDEWVSYNIKLDKWIKNMNANIAKFDQNENIINIFDDNNMIEK